MKQTLFVNLFGGPGTGKSTFCAEIFAILKKRNIDCEMALEYAKDVVWEESFHKLKNQIYIFGKQHSRLYRLNGKVDVVITDSPLINSIIYDETNNTYLKDLVLYEFFKLNTVNYHLCRSTEYNPNGRTQTLEGALQVDSEYKKLLTDNKIPYIEYNIEKDDIHLAADEICKHITRTINLNKI
jgi:hypothetical protein